MNLLLDTHAWLWMAFDAPRLPESVRQALLDPNNALSVSVATVWEIAIKCSVGKLALPIPLEELVEQQTRVGLANLLPIEAPHVLAVQALAHHHRDPFDRLLVAQALIEGMTSVTSDDALRAYGAPVLWAT